MFRGTRPARCGLTWSLPMLLLLLVVFKNSLRHTHPNGLRKRYLQPYKPIHYTLDGIKNRGGQPNPGGVILNTLCCTV